MTDVRRWDISSSLLIFVAAMLAYEMAAGFFKEAGRFELCGRMDKQIAEIAEHLLDYEKALANYHAAGDLFKECNRKVYVVCDDCCVR